MLDKRNIGKIVVILSALAFLAQPKFSYADRGQGGEHGGGRGGEHRYYGYRDHPSFGLHVSVIPEGYFDFRLGGERYYYYDGLYYRHYGPDYVIVEPPIGAVVTTVPQDFQPVIVNGVTYYTYGGVYYVYTPSGYQVVPQPVTMVQQAPMVVTQPATPTVTEQPVATTPTQVTANVASDKEESFTVNIPNDKGGYTAVLLKRSGKGFVGPQGEFYSEFPKVSQLKVMYGK